ncbi:MAG TPA: Nif3-like dinuclear metal center hexameric protein [Chitinophagaceae bacterium]|nr:Nif3-like dinuclear metal center hexameric protein [Chitinophagaceae bacterium]
MPNQLLRRAFIKKSVQAAGLTALAASAQYAGGQKGIIPAGDYTVQDVMDIILKEIPGAPFKQTVDTLKSGTANQKVTGIVTTMFATITVIEKAAKSNANFIIAHEPTFYNHEDNINWVPGSSIVKEKQALLQKHGIAVWRFHDQWHAHKPDGITYGVLKKTGWTQYYTNGNPVLEMPANSLKNIVAHIKSSLGIDHVRIIGDLSQTCKRVALLPGAWGGQAQMGLAEKQQPDVVVVGEVHEWETAEYIRDAQLMGKPVSLVVLGHSVSEEPGMEWLVEWLQPKVPGLTVKHIASNNPFTWV